MSTMSTYYYIKMFLFTKNNELVEQLNYSLWEWEKVVVIGLFRIK